jgi:uncharacterized protein (DUF4415 family)
MGRKRKNELKVKRVVTIRLSEEIISQILKEGTKQEVIEKAIMEYLRKKSE